MRAASIVARRTAGMAVPGGMTTLGAGAGVAALASSVGGEKTKGWVVPDGHVGIKTFLGNVRRDKEGNPKPVIRPPGKYPLTFLTHSNNFIYVEGRTSPLPKMAVDRMSLDGKPENIVVDAALRWRVSTAEDIYPYRAWLRQKVGELDQTVIGICGGGLRSVLTTLDISRFRDTEPIPRRELAQEGLNAPDVERMLAEVAMGKVIGDRMQYLCQEELLEECGVEFTGLSLEGDARNPLQSVSDAIRSVGRLSLFLNPQPESHENGQTGSVNIASA